MKPAAKKIMFVNRRGPYGTVYAQEALEIALIGAAFDQHICLALIDDGVFLLRPGQDTAGLGLKRFTAAYGALDDFDVHRVYVERESLEVRGLSADALVAVPAGREGAGGNLVKVVSSAELSELIAGQDILLNH